MKKERLEKEIQNWRILNITKAREARLAKLREEKEKKLNEKLDNIAVTIDAKLESEVEERIKNFLDETDVEVRKLKADFYKVFYEVGGVRGMVKWIKSNKKNKLEFYKLFVSLLKSESQKVQPVQKQGVILNIYSPEGKTVSINAREEGQELSN